MKSKTEGEIVKRDALGRVRHSPERWDELLEEFKRSGLTGQQFAKWAGIKYSSFAYWRQKKQKQQGAMTLFSQNTLPPKPVEWVEAVVGQDRAKTGQSSGLEIDLGRGLRLKVADQEQARLAGVLLRELTSGPGSC